MSAAAEVAELVAANLARAAELSEELRRTRPADVPDEYKRELRDIAHGVGITLDNRRARVAGTSRDFALVGVADGQRPQYEAEWAWGSVAYVIAHSGGRFKS